ncbi:MAG: anaerobic ribonucleoside-triphosphate reductase activating protein [Pseudomonadales bacterium]|nr:anaerobic ribonucleoside-triphosphate reductase activating protein [Pseudomonadales bacterium]
MNIPLRIGGWIPMSTVDYPDHLACVLFCQGCPWRCQYCHNPHLWAPDSKVLHAWENIESFLLRRQGLLDAVVFSGGEATLQNSLAEAITRVKSLGFRVGLHTAGIRPRSFANILGLVDWVGFDIKALPESCEIITGVSNSGSVNWRSLEILLSHGIAYECRTTVLWNLFEIEDLRQLVHKLHAYGVQRYAIQIARPQGMSPRKLPLLRPMAS